MEEHESSKYQLTKPISMNHIWWLAWMDDFVTIITTKDAPKGDFLLSITEEPQNFDKIIKWYGWIQTMKLQFDSI